MRSTFVLKLTSNGDFVWAKNLTATGYVEGYSITTDQLGNVYSTGGFVKTADFDPGANVVSLSSVSNLIDDIFIHKMDSAGNFLWVKQIGGVGHGRSSDIQSDTDGNLYVTGKFQGTTDFDPGIGVFNLTPVGSSDAFIQKVDSIGNLIWAIQMGGNQFSSGSALAIDLFNNIYTTGQFGGTVDFDPGNSIANLSANGNTDGFIQKLNQCNSYSTDVHSVCGSYTWIDGITYTESNNTATYMLPNAGGCDSVITLNLTILEDRVTDTYAVCDSLTWIDGITYTSSIDSATFILTNQNGCDSIITLDLTVFNSKVGTDVLTTCDSLTWIDGITYTSSNTSATHMLATNTGCDSLVTLDLTVLSSSASTYSFSVCDSFTWIDGNNYTSSNNTATFVTANAAGCDSVITLNLTIESVSDISTRVYGSTITTNNKTGTYLWLDCNSHFDPIPGETDSSFTAAQNGSYAVQITENGCVDTSACVTLASVGVDNLGFDNSLVLYPNPTSGELNIDLGDKIDQVEVTITDITGAIISNADFTNTSNIKTEISGPVGVYFVIISTSEGTQNFKVIKE